MLWANDKYKLLPNCKELGVGEIKIHKEGLYSQNLCKHTSVIFPHFKGWKLAILDNVKMGMVYIRRLR